MLEYLNKHLLEPSRNEGYGHRSDKELNDLELLTKLQHQGAATCLIDFTANFHIALWFACQDVSSNGQVFIINRGDIFSFREITPERAGESIKELLKASSSQSEFARLPQSETQDEPVELQQKLAQPEPVLSQAKADIYYWKPPPHENRILVQHSCFIFSSKTIKKTLYKTIQIAKEDKAEILFLLQKYYGLDDGSIFRDFTGFASSHSPNKPIKPHAETSHAKLRIANKYYQQGKYQEAIDYYTEAIKINPDFAEAYFNRGFAKAALKQYTEAIDDYTRAISINPDYGEAYNNRGAAKYDLGEYTQGVKDFTQAIRINPDNASAHANCGLVHKKSGNFPEARRDFETALRLAIEQNNQQFIKDIKQLLAALPPDDQPDRSPTI